MRLVLTRIEDVPVPELSGETWELDVPERNGTNGEPEGLVVTDDGTVLVGLDTRQPTANLCWYDRP